MRARFWGWIKAILFCFDAETVHRYTVALIRLGIYLRNKPLYLASGVDQRDLKLARGGASPPVEVFKMGFHSRVGLAAGFDKNAEILLGLPALGFGFAEIGTVTPRPQPGNDRPRLFRQAEEESLFNRMGFNGLGAEIIAQRLLDTRHKLPPHFRVGVNLGKNKDTSIDQAKNDYVKAARAFENLADYLVINVSSPNTPGLRSLQTAEALKPIVMEVVNLISGWKVKPPLLLKLAPELVGTELTSLVQIAESWGIDGWILANTLAGKFSFHHHQLDGGWSGKPLQVISRQSLIQVRQVSRKPIISVGGVMSLEEAAARINAGADLIQIYTGWIFQGPTFPAKLSQHLRSISNIQTTN